MGQRKSKPPEEDIVFLESNTSFRRKTIKQWYKGFMRDCPSGCLTEDKFRKVYEKFFPGGNAEAFSGHVFRCFDRFERGVIGFKEFMLAVEVTSRTKDPMAKLDWAFTLYDVNRDGEIDRGEMQTILQALHDMTQLEQTDPSVEPAEVRAEKVFKILDADGDGVITREEFFKGCLANKELYRIITVDPTPGEGDAATVRPSEIETTVEIVNDII